MMPNSRLRFKECWHTLSLQQLTPNHFARVVNAILTERFTLIPSCLEAENNTAAIPPTRSHRARPTPER